jgi:hypothetical protein
MRNVKMTYIVKRREYYWLVGLLGWAAWTLGVLLTLYYRLR